MSNQDASLKKQIGPFCDEDSPFFTYVIIILPAVFVWLFLAGIHYLLPPYLQTFSRWPVALVGGVFLSYMIILLLLFAWLKHRIAGIVATVLIALSWLIWILLPKPNLLGISLPEVSEMFSFMLAFFVPLVFGVVLLVFGIYIVSGYLIPTEDRKANRRKVFRFLQDYLLFHNYLPCYVMTDELREEDKLELRLKGNPFAQFTQGPGMVICDCDHAIAISDGIKFKGVQGPGVIFTGMGDQPTRTLDLRPQLRTHVVHGLTKDGIDVKVLIFVPFQVDRGGQEPKLGEIIPYRKSAAFKIVHHQQMEHPKKGEEKIKQQAWDEVPVRIATRVMQNILARYYFDELYGPHGDVGNPPRLKIAKEFAQELDKELAPLGYQRVGGGISNILPANNEVLDQRIRSWQAEWSRQVMVKQAAGHADRLRRIERARAGAQTDLILSIGQMLSELNQAGVEVTAETVLPYFLRFLEEMALQPASRRYIPYETTEGMRNLRQRLEPPKGEEGNP